MVFPKNVYTRVTRKKDRKALVNGAILLITAGAAAIAFFVVVPYLSMFAPKIVVSVLVYGLIAMIAQFFVRKYFLREAERMEEFLSRGSESFAKYMGIRNIDTAETVSVLENKVTVFEFMNGLHAVYMKIDFGRSDVQTAKSTQAAFSAAFNVLAANNIGYSDFTFREIFSETREGRNLIEVLNTVEDEKFRPFVTSIYKYVADLADLNANVPEYYLMVTTRTAFQRMELESVLEKFLAEFDKRRTSIRSLSFLDSEGVLKLAKKFYGLSAIDISRSLVIDTMDEEFFSSAVQVHKVKKGGKIYTYPDVVGIKMNSTKLS